MKLIDRLKELEFKKGVDTEESFHYNLNIIKKHVKKMNQLIPRVHPDFTLHDDNHVKTVISNLDRFCDIMELYSDENDRRLSRYEIFLLLAGAYLHDIGMILVQEEDKLRLISSQEAEALSRADLSRKIREDHPERSMKYVERNTDVLNITELDSRYIGTICFGHGDWKLEEKRYDDQPDHTDEENRNAVVRIRLLTALLQVADELDTSCERAPGYIRGVLQDLSMDPISQFHWMKHYYTGTPQYGKQDMGIDKKVIIKLTLEVPDDLHGTRIKAVLECRIRQEIDFVKPILTRYCGWFFDLNPITVNRNTGLEVTPEKVFLAYFLGNNPDKPLEILVIEDDEHYRAFYKKKLGGQYSIYYANDKESAVREIKSRKYRLILLDLRLPDNDGYYSTDVGFSILEKMSEFSPNSIVMVITAWGTIDDIEKIKDFKVIKYYASKLKFFDDLDTPQKIVEEKIKENLHLMKRCYQ